MSLTDILDFRKRVGVSDDTRSPMQRQLAQALIDDAAEEKARKLKADQAAERQEQLLNGMHAAGVSFDDLSRAQHDFAQAGEQVQAAEAALRKAQAELRSYRARLEIVQERAAVASGMVSRAGRPDEIRLSPPPWVLAQEADRNRRWDAHVRTLQRDMLQDAEARLADEGAL
jgi:hypothetical protein